MELKPGYKLTDVGVIPDDWMVRSLGALATTVASGKSKVSGGFGNFAVHGSTGVIGYCNFPEYAGDAILVARVGANAGKLNLVSGQYGVTDNTIIVRLSSDSCLPFFWRQLESKRLNSLVFGSGQPLITGTQLKALSLSVPPPAEQRAIAGALSDVDALIGALDQLLAKKRDLKQAAMQQLLTGHQRLPGFAPANPRFQQTEAGEIPDDWAATPLGELGFWKGGMTPSMRNPAYWENGTIPWASSGDIKTPVLTQTGFKITALAVKQGTTTVLPPNSLIVVMRSGILRRYLPVALNPNAVAINQDIKGLIPNDKAVPTFMLHLLTHHGSPILASCMKAGTTVESIELRWLKAYCVPLPPTAEQTAIAEVLSDMDAELAALEQKRDKTRLLKQGMMQELLTGRTRLI